MKIKTFTFNPIMENTYLLIDEESKVCIIIDAGNVYGREDLLLTNYIEDSGLTLRRVLNTHLHLDHCFGNGYLAKHFGVKPEASQKDEFLLATMKRHIAMFGIDADVEPQPLGGYLLDGDVIREGSLELHVLEIPGHSPGGLAFYCPNEGVLFSGDSLFQSSIGRTDLDGGSYADLVTSIGKKLMVLPSETLVYPGHGGTTTIGYEKQYNPYL